MAPREEFKVFLKILENLKTHQSSAEGILRESTWWIFSGCSDFIPLSL
jgi:hypothetical protein